jgi:hypothetical protein
MAGVFRTGYQAIADAVWSLVAVGSRTVTVTAFGGTTGTFSAGKPYVVATVLGKHENCDFGSGEVQQDFNLADLGASSRSEIDLTFTGPNIVMDTAGRQWAVSAEVINATTLRLYRSSISAGGNAADLPASRHFYNARRVVLA